MTNNPLLSKIKDDILKSIAHLEYSYRKVQKIDLQKNWDEDELETLESFSSRFARTSDLIIARFFKAKVVEQDPAFRGSLLDLLNQAEKFAWIASAKTWYRIRELRNVAAHEYTTDELKALYREIFLLTPEILSIKSNL